MFGISRQAYYKRQNKLKKLESEREIILDLIKPIRKRMSRVGTIKLYDMIKNDMAKNNINMGIDIFNEKRTYKIDTLTTAKLKLKERGTTELIEFEKTS